MASAPQGTKGTTASATNMVLNTDNLNRTIFISDNQQFLQTLDTGSVDLVLIDPPFSKNQTWEGNLKPPLTEDEKRIERNLMDSWEIYDPESAYDAGLEFPDLEGKNAGFEDIWDFRVRVYKEWMDELQNVCPSAYWLIHSTRHSHGDNTAAYIAFMVERMLEVRRILKPTGSAYLHCDHEANSYLRQMMDAVFGPSNFRNEIVWRRTSSHNSAKSWGPIHDTILFYSKSPKYTWNRVFQPYSKEHIRKSYGHRDENGWHRRSDLTGAGIRHGDSGQPWRGIDPTKTARHWAVPRPALRRAYPDREGLDDLSTQQCLDLLDEAGLIYWPQKGNIPRVKEYLDDSQGGPIQDLILDIPMLSATNKERTGYPTQKPQALARRIVEASSKPGDMVVDCFAGCAYVPVAAELTGRRWIACDMAPRAWTVVRRQFHKQPDLRIVTEGEYTERFTGVQPDLGLERIIKVRGPKELPKRTTDSNPLPMRLGTLPEPTYRQRPEEDSQLIWEAFVNQWGTRCWFCGLEKRASRRELQLDHIEPNRRDGTNDDCWNRALACMDCNGDKGNNHSVAETIELAYKAGRIATAPLRDEQLEVFERRHGWAKERWEQIRPRRLEI